IDDSTVVLIIEHADGSDQLKTETFRARLANYEAQLQRQQPNMPLEGALLERAQRSIANAFIERKLLMGEATRLNLTANPTEIENQIDQIVAQNRMSSREELEQAMAIDGITMDSLRTFLAEELILQQMGQQIVGAATVPTLEEIEAFSKDQGEEVWAQHILFQGDGEEVLQKANAVLDSARAGADFFALARRHSEGPSAPNGGDLGFFKKPDMVPAFSEAAFALADSGDVAPDLVKSPFGYHIIRLLGRRDAAPIDTSRARLMLTQTRQRDAYEAKYRQLREAVTIRVNPQIIAADLNEGLGQ
ncbi:MAG: peptidylprolyl isomerase, partial [Proteobacteria bacterium]|nr:peptidylprolyl isomerase [Pseudomonadota bacterium]